MSEIQTASYLTGMTFEEAMRCVRHGATAARPGASVQIRWYDRGLVLAGDSWPESFNPTAEDQSAADWYLINRA